MDLFERIGEHIRENRSGILTDLVFAIVWVTLVNAIFTVLDGPQWAYYLCLLAGIVVYFGLVVSLELAKTEG